MCVIDVSVSLENEPGRREDSDGFKWIPNIKSSDVVYGFRF